jgi:hypothetical protein
VAREQAFIGKWKRASENQPYTFEELRKATKNTGKKKQPKNDLSCSF